MKLRQLSLREYVSFSGNVNGLPMVCIGAEDDSGAIVGCGGLTWALGRCLLWFESDVDGVASAFAAVRAGRQLLARARMLGETEVFAIQDEIETAPRLLKLVGMVYWRDELLEMADGSLEQRKVWICRV